MSVTPHAPALRDRERERVVPAGAGYFFSAAFFSAFNRAFSSALSFSLYCFSISAA